VTSRRIRPTVTTCNARSRKAREPPRSMRWCQRRCDRGIRARDPDVCCADALFLRKRPSPRTRRPPAGGREHIVGRREATSGFTTVQPPVLRRRPGSHRQRSRARPHLQSHVRPAGRITPRRPLPCKQPQTSGTSIHPGLKFPALPSAAPASGVGSASSEAWAQPRCVVESRSTEDTVL